MTARLLRVIDVVLAGAIVVVLSPVLCAIAVAAALGQGRPLLYQAPRVGLNGKTFRMKKFRTMSVGADRGASSTSSSDARITPLGARLRRRKLDELPQLFNVIAGEMSLVGPRPQIQWVVDDYDDTERRLLTVRPGMTDLASLWFSNEGERLEGYADPDAAYDRLIAPGKTALALVYADNLRVGLYFRVLLLTARAVAGWDPRPTIEVMTGMNADALAKDD